MSALEDLHPELAALLDTVIHDRYHVDTLLGRGGMGAVFKARHIGLRRDVAIKVLRPGLSNDESMGKRFDREAQSVSRLDHPNCVRVTDFGATAGDIKYLVMELLEGSELEAELSTPWDAARTIDTGIQILEGLEHAHHFGIVHRDLKPENVFLTRDFRGREIVKLVDFGIAKLIRNDTAEQLTRQGMVFGTPRYMSPEQASGGKLDERTDLYATGLLLYEMLAGHGPFVADEVAILLRMQILAPPPPLPSAVPASLGAVVMKLLEKSRKNRYASARETIAALEAARAQLEAPAGAVVASASAQLPSPTGPTALASDPPPSSPLAAPTAHSLPTAANPGIDDPASTAPGAPTAHSVPTAANPGIHDPTPTAPSGWHAATPGHASVVIPAPTIPPLGASGSAHERSGSELSGPALSGPALSGPALSGPALSSELSGPAMSGNAMSGPSMSANAPTQFPHDPHAAHTLETFTPAADSPRRPWLPWVLGIGGILLALMAFGAGQAMREDSEQPGAAGADPSQANPRFDQDCSDKVCGCEDVHECDLSCGKDCSLRCADTARCELVVGEGSWVHCERFGKCEVDCLGECRVTCPSGDCEIQCPLPPERAHEDEDSKKGKGPKRHKSKKSSAPPRPEAKSCGDDVFVCGSCE